MYKFRNLVWCSVWLCRVQVAVFGLLQVSIDLGHVCKGFGAAFTRIWILVRFLVDWGGFVLGLVSLHYRNSYIFVF